ncbi:hypothetical protein PaG_01216 [Moesziomyces aphidis]|uniref:Cytochrome c oxidase polypeptide VIIA n=1 Tax=Moesziomyces aphidis TaxID=84754 RepID=W3VS89_MOEAP|nr:hypothetical protein PaG_01216 [Moesziomyces aphidis]
MACEKQPEGRSSSDPSNLRLWKALRERGGALPSPPSAATLISSRFDILPPSCHLTLRELSSPIRRVGASRRAICTDHGILSLCLKMPVGSIPAITGKLRKRLILDLTVALGGGTALGYGYWYGVHVPSVARRDAFYAKLQSERSE